VGGLRGITGSVTDVSDGSGMTSRSRWWIQMVSVALDSPCRAGGSITATWIFSTGKRSNFPFILAGGMPPWAEDVPILTWAVCPNA
jgi:hypothetical protein